MKSPSPTQYPPATAAPEVAAAPMRATRKLAACGATSWRDDFRAALFATDCTQDVVAEVLGVSRQLVTMILRPDSGRRLTADHLDQLREHPATADLWRAYMQRQWARADRRSLDREARDAAAEAGAKAGATAALVALRRTGGG